MNNTVASRALTAALSLLLASVSAAEVRLSPLCSDHAILQRSPATRLFGTASPGESITVTLAGKSATVTTPETGQWSATLDLSAAPAEPQQLTVKSANGQTLTADDILIGQVWVCSGQSNMEWTVRRAKDADTETASANYPAIRHFRVARNAATQPTTDLSGKWVVCSPQTVGEFTAVGYFFARDIHAKLNVPVGLIHSSWGGTPAEAWTSIDRLAATPDLAHFVQVRETALKLPPPLPPAATTPTTTTGPTTSRPANPPGAMNRSSVPAQLYNGMILPITPVTVAGTLWYQGESNASRAHQYRTLMRELILDWRDRFQNPTMPFYLVQLAAFNANANQPANVSWAELREAQQSVLDLPNTGMATAIDVGERSDIHPKNKQDVGRRLALIALKNIYGQTVSPDGPTFTSATPAGDTLTIKFAHAEGGLVAKGPLEGAFEVAGDDGVYHPAQAAVSGDAVTLKSTEVPAPKTARYAWANCPPTPLYNTAGLPSLPFRTDTQPYTTLKNK